jgi:hypothetical protein
MGERLILSRIVQGPLQQPGATESAEPSAEVNAAPRPQAMRSAEAAIIEHGSPIPGEQERAERARILSSASTREPSGPTNRSPEPAIESTAAAPLRSRDADPSLIFNPFRTAGVSMPAPSELGLKQPPQTWMSRASAPADHPEFARTQGMVTQMPAEPPQQSPTLPVEARATSPVALLQPRQASTGTPARYPVRGLDAKVPNEAQTREDRNRERPLAPAGVERDRLVERIQRVFIVQEHRGHSRVEVEQGETRLPRMATPPLRPVRSQAPAVEESSMRARPEAPVVPKVATTDVSHGGSAELQHPAIHHSGKLPFAPPKAPLPQREVMPLDPPPRPEGAVPAEPPSASKVPVKRLATGAAVPVRAAPHAVPSHELVRGASAATASRPATRSSVTISIGKLEILQKPPSRPAPVSISAPRAHQIDPGLSFGALSPGRW